MIPRIKLKLTFNNLNWRRCNILTGYHQLEYKFNSSGLELGASLNAVVKNYRLKLTDKTVFYENLRRKPKLACICI